jgi:hypothetical protein
MLAWYKTVFGAKVQYKDPAIAFLTYDEEHHRFAFANMDLIDPGGGGPDDRGGHRCRPRGLHLFLSFGSLR